MKTLLVYHRLDGEIGEWTKGGLLPRTISFGNVLVTSTAVYLFGGNLDSKNAELVMALLDKLHAEGKTICMVTHDPRGAERAERIVEIFDGRIVSDIQTQSAVA